MESIYSLSILNDKYDLLVAYEYECVEICMRTDWDWSVQRCVHFFWCCAASQVNFNYNMKGIRFMFNATRQMEFQQNKMLLFLFAKFGWHSTTVNHSKMC